MDFINGIGREGKGEKSLGKQSVMAKNTTVTYQGKTYDLESPDPKEREMAKKILRMKKANKQPIDNIGLGTLSMTPNATIPSQPITMGQGRRTS